MTTCVCVYGMGHLGYVTAGCLAEAYCDVIALGDRVCPNEPGLLESLSRGAPIAFSDDLADVAKATILWVSFDTPVADNVGDSGWVREQLEAIRPHISDGTLVIVSSQVPVGFTAALERDWQSTNPTLRFAHSPENIRHGYAIDDFRHPSRIVIGLGADTPIAPLAKLFHLFSSHLEWTSLGAAEMSKHALNGFLALSAVYANELSRLCTQLGVDYREVERALRTEPRIGKQAYVAARGPVEGSLLRDVEYLRQLADGIRTTGSMWPSDDNWYSWSPIADAVLVSNAEHREWEARVAQR